MENKSSMVARPSGQSGRWPRARDGDRARGVQGVPRDAQGARRAGNKMKIGDLVRYTREEHSNGPWFKWTGIIIDQTLGSARYQTVRWLNPMGAETSTPAKHLTVISENKS